MIHREKVISDRFFLQWRYGKVTKQPFGHNSIAQFPKKIASYLNLANTETYTGHCFRRTAATLLANTGADVLQLKRLGGWKSSTVAESYVDNSVVGQVKIANILTSNTNIDDEPGPSKRNINNEPGTSNPLNSQGHINPSNDGSIIINNSNVTIYFNK